MLRWPASPSPIPSWAMGSTTLPIYTMATTPTPSAAAVAAPSGAHQPPPTSGVLYGGVVDPLFQQGPQVLHASSAPGPFPQPVSWPPQPSNGLLTAEESSSPALLSTSPSLIPSFTTPSPVPPQQDSDGVFYGGVDGIQASAA